MFSLKFFIGVAVGAVATTVVSLLLPAAGVLKIDHTNPEKDTYLFEIYNLEILSKKKRIILKVDTNASLSQD